MLQCTVYTGKRKLQKVIFNSDTKIGKKKKKHSRRFPFDTSLVALMLDKLPQATQMY